MFKEYYHFIKDYYNLVEIKISYVLINFFSAFFYKGFGLLLPLIASLIVKYLTDGNSDMTYLFIIIYAITYFLYHLSLYANYKIYGYNVSYCYHNMQKKVLTKLINVDSNFSKKFSKGRLMNTINSDIINIGDMNDEIAELLMGILQLIAVVIIVSCYNIYIGLIFIFYTIIYINVKNDLDRYVDIYYNKTIIEEDKYSHLLSQISSGLQEIKTFNMLPKLLAKLKTIQNKFTKNYHNKRKYLVAKDIDSQAITYLFRGLLYMLLIILMLEGKIGIDVLILVIAYHERLVTYIEATTEASAAIREANTYVRRVDALLNYHSNQIIFGNQNTEDLYGSIEFQNVSLKINENKILKNIDLKIDHNTVTAIVGEAGAGKTMLFNLLLRLYKPNQGNIYIDNTNIYDLSKEIYTSTVAIVNQKPFVFNMSIRKNLDFVDKNIEHQIAACKRAGIHNFIETLPNGYNTILREGGTNISGGQKQMISIARTILTDSEILLLDDITTSLDPDTAKLVPKLIKDLKKDHTIVIITKKPDLMKNADRIIVLDKGSIIAEGTHQELINSCEIYQNLQANKSPSKVGVFNHD